MWWLVTLLVLAIAAFFIVKTMKSNTLKQQAEHDRQQQERLSSIEPLSGTNELADLQDNHASGGASIPPHGSDMASDASSSTPGAAATGSSAAAGAVAAAGAAAAGVAASGVAAMGAATSESASMGGSSSTLPSGSTLDDVREMVKILNLDGPDAGRLQIESEQLIAIRKGDAAGAPDAATLDSVASKLRQMLA